MKFIFFSLCFFSFSFIAKGQIKNGAGDWCVYYDTPVVDTGIVTSIVLKFKSFSKQQAELIKRSSLNLLRKIDRFPNLKSLTIMFILKKDSSLLSEIDNCFNDSAIQLPIKEFRLHACEVNRLPSFVSRLCNLESLDISCTRITKLPLTLKRLTRLKDFCYNGFSSEFFSSDDYSETIIENDFTKALIGIFSLEKVWINKVIFSDLKMNLLDLSQMKNLKKLDLANCSISKMPQEIGLLKNLEYLNLMNLSSGKNELNTLNALPIEIFSLKKLMLLLLPPIFGIQEKSIKAKVPVGCQVFTNYQTVPYARGY